MKNFGKMLGLFIISLCVILMITACGGDIEDPGYSDPGNEDENNDQGNGDENNDPEDMDNEYFEIVDNKDEPLENWAEGNKTTAGEYQYPDDENIYMIAAGEQNTGGYSIEITEEEVNEGILTITYTVQSPGPDDVVTQAISYPYLLIEVSEEIEEVDFVKE